MDANTESMIENYIKRSQDGSPLSANYPLIPSPWPTWGIVVFYLLCVYFIFPAYMRNRKPYSLRTPILVYNSFLVLCNLYAFIQSGRLGWFSTYSWFCSPVDDSVTKESKQMADVMYLIFVLRFVELFETIFFILRKKDNQVNKLHVIHHFLVPPVGRYCLKYGPVGCGTFFPFINTFVHIVMYSYYALSSLGPEVQKFLWWKRYITRLQLIQFVMAIIYYTKHLVDRSCQCPVGIALQYNGLGILFLVMFSNYYRHIYKKTNISTDKEKPTHKKFEENGSATLGHSNGFYNSSVRSRNNLQSAHA